MTCEELQNVLASIIDWKLSAQAQAHYSFGRDLYHRPRPGGKYTGLSAGAKGYGQRFGAVAADGLSDIMIGGAILPSLRTKIRATST
jgi:hypothetical protein